MEHHVNSSGAINPNLSKRKKPQAFLAESLSEAIRSGNRSALSRGITLLESSKVEDQRTSSQLLAYSTEHETIRIGVSGPPGAGKSTFIEALGLALANEGKQVAVLAFDPSSERSGGSVLGDKTRMEQLSRNPNAFIRPSPNRGVLGGVGRHTREVIHLCEMGGFDYILVESVGAGQSEFELAHLVDLFLVVLAPAAGDELQAIKKGIMEMADLVLINKCDGALMDLCQKMLNSMRRAGFTDNQLYPISALKNLGIEKLIESCHGLWNDRKLNGEWLAKRNQQNLTWFRKSIEDRSIQFLLSRHLIQEKIKALGNQVSNGQSPFQASYLFQEYIQTLWSSVEQ